MRFSTRSPFSFAPEASPRGAARQFVLRRAFRPEGARRTAVAGLIAAALTGCAVDPKVPEGVVGHVSGFLGGIAADEPRSVLVGRDILSAGGSAADAAVAMAFALSVTLPSSAGIGGGGLCIVHHRQDVRGRPLTGTVEVIDFLPRSTPGGAVAPALPRGLYALHAKYGRLGWEQLVVPAENLARFGHTVSRSLATEFAAAAGYKNLRALRPFHGGDGRPLAEGAGVTQLELAATLGRIRRNPAEFYVGAFARDVAAAVSAAGAPLAATDLRNTVPRWLAPAEVRMGSETLVFPPAEIGGPAPLLWDALLRDRSFNSLASDRRFDAVTTVAHKIGAAGARDKSGLDGATGFVVADRSGDAVACTLTMGSSFGTGRPAGSLGFAVADPASADFRPAVMLMVNRNSAEFRFGGAASGAAAPAALARVGLGVLAADESVGAALKAPRAEDARVNVVSCPLGLPPVPASCRVGTEPRGSGLSFGAEG